jgi:2-dehydro-3-deoxy-L-rhamnonate dehydrogenase (NAD+)
MKTRLDGQTAIITGAARGIGLGIARRMADLGAKIIVWDADLAPLKDAKDFVAARTAQVDVTSYASVEAAFQAAIRDFGQVHILVNNAGINGPIHPAWDYPLETWDKVIAVNLTGVFYASRVAVKHMRAKKYGRIIQIASIAGKEGVVNLGAYSAAKGGVIALAKSMAKEVCTDGVTVNCIAPAMTETALFAQMTEEHIRNMKAKIPMGRFIQIDEIAELAAWIASPACSATTGFVFDITGGRATY